MTLSMLLSAVLPLAQDAAAPPAANPLGMIIPFVLMFAIMYFLIIRPQSQARKKHMDLVSSAKRGDTVITSGGLVGKITKSSDGSAEVTVEIADGVQVKVVRGTLSEVRGKGEAVATDNKNDTKNGNKNDKK